MANIKTSAAELIGKTPLLEVKKFEAKENITDAKILAKLEYFNPAGSVIITLYPFAAATAAIPIPVLPDVG